VIPTIIAFWYMVVGHFVADYVLQSEFIVNGKNPRSNPQRVPWYYVMASHSLLHGAFVSIVAGNIIDHRHTLLPVVLGMLESILHFFIDMLKCVGCTGIHLDQGLHILCKLAWTGAVILWVYDCVAWGWAGAWLFAAALCGLTLFVARRQFKQRKCEVT
jgi:hypothetical protein